MKLTPDQLGRAAGIARDIEALEKARDGAADEAVTVQVPTGMSSMHPLGHVTVHVVVPATEIRAKLVDMLTPLYTELRNLGFELDL